jgi:hypothetical protein
VLFQVAQWGAFEDALMNEDPDLCDLSRLPLAAASRD